MGKVINFFTRMGEEKMEKGVLDAKVIAKAFLSMDSMTNKKLQKLCYYAQAWHYAFYKKGLFYNDIEAWVHGPVIPEVYNVYSGYRWNEIPTEETLPTEISKENNIFLAEIFKTYKGFSGDELESLTHAEQPWLKAREGLQEWEPSHRIIDEKLMADYYWGIYETSQQ